MMKSIFDDCKELAKKTDSENQRSFAEDSFKKVSSGATFQIKLQFKGVQTFPFDLQLLLVFKMFLF